MKTVYARNTCIYSHRSLYRILIGTCIRPPQRSWFSQTIEGNFWRIECQRVLALSTTQTTAFEKSWGSTFFNFASCYDVLILHTSFGNGHLICPWWCLRKSNLSAVGTAWMYMYVHNADTLHCQHFICWLLSVLKFRCRCTSLC